MTGILSRLGRPTLRLDALETGKRSSVKRGEISTGPRGALVGPDGIESAGRTRIRIIALLRLFENWLAIFRPMRRVARCSEPLLSTSRALFIVSIKLSSRTLAGTTSLVFHTVVQSRVAKIRATGSLFHGRSTMTGEVRRVQRDRQRSSEPSDQQFVIFIVMRSLFSRGITQWGLLPIDSFFIPPSRIDDDDDYRISKIWTKRSTEEECSFGRSRFYTRQCRSTRRAHSLYRRLDRRNERRWKSESENRRGKESHQSLMISKHKNEFLQHIAPLTRLR